MNEKKSNNKIKSLFESVSSEDKVSGKMILLLLGMFVSFLMIVICIINLVSGISVDKRNNTELELPEVTESEPAETTAAETEPKVTVSEYVLNTAQINQFEYEQIIEAEDTEGCWSLTESDIRPGYSGTGYLTEFDTDLGNSLVFEFDIPSEQHYDISVCFASDEVVENEIYLNGEELFDFECTQETTGRFVIKTYYGVFLEKGSARLTVHEVDSGFDLDYIKLRNNRSIYSAKTDIAPDLINHEASAEAKDLMKYLTDNFGKRILTGQYVSDFRNIEINKIYEHTSNYPAIRFGDLSQYSRNTDEKTDSENDEVTAGLKWAENGGIVGYMWHWKAPMYENEFYSEKTEFDLSLAVTDIDIALMSAEEIDELYQDDLITAETVNIIYDIDNISYQLARLRDRNIPVLWRPLHEASGDWFWWGDSGPDAYKWLWNLLYRRQTEYHHLNNLIWIWSAQGTEYFVGNSAFDIASVDLYNENTDNTSYYKQYQWLYSLTGGQKLIALSECGRLPDMELTFRDRAVWSFFGLWYGDYVLDKNGNLSEKYNSRESFFKMYNSNRTITLEKYKNKSVLKEDTPVTTAPVTTAVTTAASTAAVTTVPSDDDDEPDDEEADSPEEADE